MKSSSGYTLVRVLPTSSSSSFEYFPDRGPKRRKQTLYFGDHRSHFTRKNTGFHTRVSFQAWIHAFPRWHDGENADHANCIFQLCSGAMSVRVKSSSRGSLVHILPCKLDHTNPKPHWIPQFFRIVLVISWYRYSLAHMLPCEPDHTNPKVLPESLQIFMWNRALATVSCTFCPTNSTTSCSKCLIFSRFLCETELPLQYRAHFADLIFQKCSETLNFFLNIFKCNRSSRNSPVQPVHVLSRTFADRGPQPRKQRLYFGDHRRHFTRKNTGCRAKGFQVWIHAFPPNYLMMMWLTWFCGWHDGENAAHDNRP